jgi:hypothetical protein
MDSLRARAALVLVAACLAAGRPAFSDGPVAFHLEPTEQADSAQSRSRAMADRIDELMEQQWRATRIEPAPPAGDSQFLRRITLDLTGVIPRVSKVRQFLSETRPDKRDVLIEELLASPRYATHMATTWRNRILPHEVEPSRSREALALQKWLRSRFAKNLRYDNLVGELLLTLGGDELGPALYFQANDLQPEKLASSAAELFLGVQLHCAQCHDHPYAEWSQRDFWGLAAFFAQVQARDARRMGMMALYRLDDADEGDVRLPDTNEVVPPKYPRGENAGDDARRSRRAALAVWMTSRDNRYFSRAAVNWAWSHLFGRGLVDSLDELDGSPETVKAQLVDELADYFVQGGFDLQELWRALARTRTYQLACVDGERQSALGPYFACKLPKPLTPEQLYDSFLLLSPPSSANTENARSSDAAGMLDEDPLRLEFVRRMRAPPGVATEYRAGTLQALMLMNGAVASTVSRPDSRLVSALEAPFLTDEDRVDALFLAAIARRPDAEEREAIMELLAGCETEAERRHVLSDILWALLNSAEFAFNH